MEVGRLNGNYGESRVLIPLSTACLYRVGATAMFVFGQEGDVDAADGFDVNGRLYAFAYLSQVPVEK